MATSRNCGLYCYSAMKRSSSLKYSLPQGVLENSNNPTGRVSQIDLELAIETEQIVKVLNQTINKIELALCLPLLLENETVFLSSCLTKEELSLVTSACEPYIRRFCDFEEGSEKGSEYKQQYSLRENDDFKRKNISGIIFEDREDVNIWRALMLLYRKPAVRDKIKELLPQISSAANSFITYMKQLERSAMESLSTTPLQHMAKEQALRRIWNRNEAAKKEIVHLSKCLEDQNNELQLKVMAKNLMINQHEGKIERMNKKFKDDLRKRVLESEERIMIDCKESEMQQQFLTLQIKDLNARKRSLMRINLAEEKELRLKKQKVETLLISWLNKYDEEIGEKQAEYDDIMAAFEEEKKKMQELKEQFAVQDEEYRRLMKEKEEGEKAVLQKKLNAFISNRSAKKIQRYWRAYRARKLARRKGRKKKKGSAAKKN